MGSRVIARLQTAWIVLNLAYALFTSNSRCALTSIFCRLFLAVIIGLPIATPKEFMNTPKYAFGDFQNGKRIPIYQKPNSLPTHVLANEWPNGFAFILSFLAPLWAIGQSPLNVSSPYSIK